MGDISTHFDRSEFACKCGCGFDTVDTALIEMLEAVRQHFDKPVTVTSGCRCPANNTKVGGSTASKHLYGRAADINVKGVDTKSVFRFLDASYPESAGVGLYSSWVHIDSRAKKARWGN